jgi:hypothetical protein
MATVTEHQEDRVRVEHDEEALTVPTEGFPPNFRLRPGEKVILFDGPSGPVARPVVQAITPRVSHDALQRRGPLEVEGRRLALQDSTVVYDPEGRRADAAASEEHVLWIVEPGEAKGPSQVVAARRQRRD